MKGIQHVPDLDPNRTDIYLCPACSYSLKSYIFHEWDDKGFDPDTELIHVPQYNRSVPVGMQFDLFMYEHRVSTFEQDQLIARFIKKRQFEHQLGLRDPEIKPLSVKAVTPTINTLAKRTDITDMPMLPDEIVDWVYEIRALHDFPAYVVNTPVFNEVTLEEALTQAEVLLLCLWMNEKIFGAGSQMFAGRILEQANLTEEKLEKEGWNYDPDKRD